MRAIEPHRELDLRTIADAALVLDIDDERIDLRSVGQREQAGEPVRGTGGVRVKVDAAQRRRCPAGDLRRRERPHIGGSDDAGAVNEQRIADGDAVGVNRYDGQRGGVSGARVGAAREGDRNGGDTGQKPVHATERGCTIDTSDAAESI
jgi:hypothetical protein